MALQFLFDFLTGQLALVDAPTVAVIPPTGNTGKPMGLLLALTYAS